MKKILIILIIGVILISGCTEVSYEEDSSKEAKTYKSTMEKCVALEMQAHPEDDESFCREVCKQVQLQGGEYALEVYVEGLAEELKEK